MAVSRRMPLILGLALAIGLAAAVSPLASSSPDGLERVAAEQGFEQRGETHPVQNASPAPDYAFPGVEDPRLATGLAGGLGTLAAFGLAAGAAALLRRRAGPTGTRTAAGA